MMKKRILLLMLPLLLGGVIFLVQKERRKRIDSDFRWQILRDATTGGTSRFVILIEDSTDFASLWALTSPRLKEILRIKEILTDVHLQKVSSPKVTDQEIWLRFMASDGDLGFSSGFSIALDGEQNYISGGGTVARVNSQWNQFELTPQSVQALKRRILSRYGKQIEAFRRRKSKQ